MIQIKETRKKKLISFVNLFSEKKKALESCIFEEDDLEIRYHFESLIMKI